MDKTVTRATLSEQAAEATGLARSEVAAIGQLMFELLGAALMAGETVKLTGFGSLQVRSRARRMGRNPRTGDAHPIAPHRAVIFVPGARLRAALDQPGPGRKPQK
ncbi:MAG: hypothetical protein ABS76_38695 [Pelagibacterium sp. SCN 64-44]|nr:MAG: hypothetical protein ABS76_38695 [Pelagibacterium sp. SCN 64-44]